MIIQYNTIPENCRLHYEEVGQPGQAAVEEIHEVMYCVRCSEMSAMTDDCCELKYSNVTHTHKQTNTHTQLTF